MIANHHDIERWIEKGKEHGATHLIVVCDKFDFTNYPIYVLPGEDAREKYNAKMKSSMQTVDEVYDLTGGIDIKEQLEEYRAFHLPPETK